MRAFALIAALLVTAASHASFDLMLLGDNSTAGSERVIRYDPVNRVQLGSFGQGFLNAAVADVAVDGATGRAFVLQVNGGVRVFNYNTGDFIDGFTLSGSYGAIAFDSTSNRITFGQGGGNGITPGKVYDANTLSLAADLTGTFMATAPLRRPGTSWYASYGIDLAVANHIAYRHSITGGAPLSSTTITSFASSSSPREAIFTADNRLMGVLPGGGGIQLWSIGTDASGFVGSHTTTTVPATFANNLDIANGHGNLAYILNGSSVLSYHTGLNQVMGTQTLASSTYQGMAVVVAPEPGTMLALAGGVLALLRKRRKVKP